jgi:hypothetical protein
VRRSQARCLLIRRISKDQATGSLSLYAISVVIWAWSARPVEVSTAANDGRTLPCVPLTKVLLVPFSGAIDREVLDVLVDRVKEWLATRPWDRNGKITLYGPDMDQTMKASESYRYDPRFNTLKMEYVVVPETGPTGKPFRLGQGGLGERISAQAGLGFFHPHQDVTIRCCIENALQGSMDEGVDEIPATSCGFHESTCEHREHTIPRRLSRSNRGVSSLAFTLGCCSLSVKPSEKAR